MKSEIRNSKSEKKSKLEIRIPIQLGLLIFLLAASFANAAESKQAIEARQFSFPADHGSHAGFQTEWWYVTGVVNSADGKKFGYQFTIFRRAVDPQSPVALGRKSKWAATDLYLGHAAITDISAQDYVCTDALQRGALGIAGATSNPAAVSLANWEFRRLQSGWKLRCETPEIALNLKLDETLPPVLHGRPGEEGLSRKGPNLGQASYYYSVPRLKTTGTLRVREKSAAIAAGFSWMDHEFGSNQLSENQTGWEWFSLHFDNGESLMLYLLRRKDGSIEPTSSGTWVDSSGKSSYIPLSEIQAVASRNWTSPHSKNEYQLDWTIKIARKNAELNISALIDDQEFHSARRGGFAYYEGAVRVAGKVNDREIKGEGYLEIAGKSSSSLGGKL